MLCFVVDVYTFFRTFLGGIPSTFWAVAFGSLLSLAGVMLSNVATNRRWREQLEFQRQTQSADREIDLRKDVYMAAAEAISTGLIGIGKLSDLELPISDSARRFEEKAPTIAKVQVVGTENTLRAVTKLTTALSTAYIELVTKRMPLDVEKQKIVSLDQQIAKFERNRDQMLEHMRQFNLEQRADRREWEIIQGEFNFEEQRIENAIGEKLKVFGSVYDAQLKFMEECAAKSAEIALIVVPALVAIRQELGLPIDEAAYRKIISSTHDEMRDVIGRLVIQARDMVSH